ncbi:CFEM domain-containing protein [Colletotrichum falcatum]|nr:CFEM domain-containing protein [Colletotrichum falcatum]
MATGRFFALLVCLLGFGSVAMADLSLSGIPKCAITCIFQELGHTRCSITDQACICNDQVFNSYVETCVQSSCTVKEMLVTKNQTLTACGVPPAPKYDMMSWFRGLLFGVQTFFVILKVANKLMKISPWGWDDLTILIAYANLAAFFPLSSSTEKSGAGRDIWTLTPDEITHRLLTIFICSLLYICGLAFIKASILFLYLRIFPDQTFRWILWGTQIFNLLVGVSFMIGTVTGCLPLNFFWDGWTGEMDGKCFDLNAFALCNGAFNLALDVWMLALPASQTYNLRMNWKKKAGVMLMFGVGAFLTAVSAYRIKALLDFATSYNITANSFLTSLFSHIELCVGIFVACLPSANQLWGTLSPKIVQAAGLSSRLLHPPKASRETSNASQTLPVAHKQPPPPVASSKGSSMRHFVEEFDDIDLDSPGPSPTATEYPRTPIKMIEKDEECFPGSSRS